MTTQRRCNEPSKTLIRVRPGKWKAGKPCHLPAGHSGEHANGEEHWLAVRLIQPKENNS